jgi:NADP-dependent 3-hydroxy acid dehydrogenase YdfG
MGAMSEHPTGQRTAVVTGASSGIGAATARALAAHGFRVVCAARRTDRITELAAEIGGEAVTCDITDPDAVAALAAAVPTCHVLVNNAGGAVGVDRVGQADVEAWRRMYDINVLGLVRVTKALLPALRASGDGVIVNVGSTAGRWAYEGGGGYTAAKHAVKVVTETLRLELNGEPIRISEVAPGMVRTEEFSLVRFGGDKEKADAVYEGVDPVTPEEVAECVLFALTRPMHVNLDEIVIKALAQSSGARVVRKAT